MVTSLQVTKVAYNSMLAELETKKNENFKLRATTSSLHKALVKANTRASEATESLWSGLSKLTYQILGLQKQLREADAEKEKNATDLKTALEERAHED